MIRKQGYRPWARTPAGAGPARAGHQRPSDAPGLGVRQRQGGCRHQRCPGVRLRAQVRRRARARQLRRGRRRDSPGLRARRHLQLGQHAGHLECAGQPRGRWPQQHHLCTIQDRRGPPSLWQSRRTPLETPIPCCSRGGRCMGPASGTWATRIPGSRSRVCSSSSRTSISGALRSGPCSRSGSIRRDSSRSSAPTGNSTPRRSCCRRSRGSCGSSSSASTMRRSINCWIVAGCATFGQPTSSGNSDVYCHSCSFDNGQLRMDRVNVTCVGCHFETVESEQGVPLISVGSGMFNWLGGFMLVGGKGPTAGVFLSDSNFATNSLANIVGVSAYKPGKPIPFVELAPKTSINLNLSSVRIQGSGFATMVGGYQSGTPNSARHSDAVPLDSRAKVRRGSSHVRRAVFAPSPTARP